MKNPGYYRSPAIHKDKIIFVSDDDLWAVSKQGGAAQRLTTGLGANGTPVFSPDGTQIAFGGSDEGHLEVYVMPAMGGPARRLTFQGDMARVIDWTANGIIFTSSYGQPFARCTRLFCLSPEGGLPDLIPYGYAGHISYGPGKAAVLQRHGSREYGYWKRYRGGTAGVLWIDRKGTGAFEPLIDLKGNISRCLWIQDRIYFISDHEGIGNLYSCLPSGKDLKRHTHHDDYYMRNIATDGNAIVYHAGADLYVYDLKTQKTEKVSFHYPSSRSQRNRKFVSPSRYLDSYDLHPQGHSLALVARGSAHLMGNWEGAVHDLPSQIHGRYRHLRWLKDGEKVVGVNDASGEETLELYQADSMKKISAMKNPKIGQVWSLEISPQKDEAIATNNRGELIHVDLKTWKTKVLDRNPFGAIPHTEWSPDGHWIAYSCAISQYQSVIKVVNPAKGKPQAITRPVLCDTAPTFDPEGKYLYFLSYRQFQPSWDTLQFNLNFPRGVRPYAICLQKDTHAPFESMPKSFSIEETKKGDKKDKKAQKPAPLHIDFAGIEDRLVAFPVPDGVYHHIVGLKGKVLFTRQLPEGSEGEGCSKAAEETLEVFDFKTQRLETLVPKLKAFRISMDREWLGYWNSGRLRVIKAGEKLPEAKMGIKEHSEHQGWIDLNRLSIEITPPEEWRQIMNEAWRQQRDMFWREDMCDVDWEAVRKRYLPLLDRIGTRGEFSDLLWEMQGELGTSHAYVMGGDHRRSPHFGTGSLGADFAYDPKHKAYRIEALVKGDPWNRALSSPLLKPGVNVQEKEFLYAIGAEPLSKTTPPEAKLVHRAGKDVLLTVGTGKKTRTVTVTTLQDDQDARYREWVEAHRAYVHKKTDGKVGYVHIPDMSADGYAEFHRGFLSEYERDALVVDVRFNGGGCVSSLLLEKLARKRLGYDVSRWHAIQEFPRESVAGPMVALTNEYAGSDGDMFSHVFKTMKLGPLIGKRTWGGVIGIWPRRPLVDRGTVTQPEFAAWFHEGGWGLENYGAEPDIDVDYRPQDHAKGVDPQLDRGIAEVLKILKENPPLAHPDMKTCPSLKAPKLKKA